MTPASPPAHQRTAPLPFRRTSCEPACPHAFLLAHDVAITYLRPDARGMLQASGVEMDGPESSMELNDACHDSRWDIIGAHLQISGARILAAYAPAPVFDGIYVGIADA